MNYLNKYFNQLEPLYPKFDKLVNALELGFDINILGARQVGITTLLTRIYVHSLFMAGNPIYFANNRGNIDEINYELNEFSEKLSLNLNKPCVMPFNANKLDIVKIHSANRKLFILENIIHTGSANSELISLFLSLKEKFPNAQFIIANSLDCSTFDSIRCNYYRFVNFKFSKDLSAMTGLEVYEKISQLGFERFKETYILDQ